MPVLVRFGETMRKESYELKRFLFHNLYRHHRVVQTTDQAKQVVRDLFAMYLAQPQEMKPAYADRVAMGDDARGRARVVADFIAGMTDRYASREHERLTGQRLLA
jgi:dGTPase